MDKRDLLLKTRKYPFEDGLRDVVILSRDEARQIYESTNPPAPVVVHVDDLQPGMTFRALGYGMCRFEFWELDLLLRKVATITLLDQNGERLRVLYTDLQARLIGAQRERVDDLSACEAVTAFASWLSKKLASPDAGLAGLAEEFCKEQQLPAVREGWQRRIRNGNGTTEVDLS